MIIVKLQGGLGNQMFQYALGRALGLRTGDAVLFDKSWFIDVPAHETIRAFALDIFSLPIRFADKKDIPLEQRNVLLRRLPFWRALCGRPAWVVLFDHSPVAQKRILEWRAGGNVFLQGFWQSEKYFKDAEDVIRNDFAFRAVPDEANQAMLDKMASDLRGGVESVSVHVRRGDYSSDPKTHAHHGLLPLEYYQSAMSVIDKRFPRGCYYVFSDDLSWCRDNLRFKGEGVFVDVNAGKPAWMDMRLMTRCRHHIIANSSFSWWGAWLNASPDKVVVAPQQWLSQARLVNDDIWPGDWLKIL